MQTVHGFVVTTVCRTVEEFVERYFNRVSGRTLFVGVIEPRALGGECAFAIQLADRTIVLAGVCEVLDVYPHAENAYGARGMRLSIRRLGMESEGTWTKLVERGQPPVDERPIDEAIEAAIAAATKRAPSAISSNDLSAYAIEFDEQTTTVPIQRAAMN